MSGGKMYWTDGGTCTIQRANLNGGSVEELFSLGLWEPRGIALDVVGGKMYWVGGTHPQAMILRANMDGTGEVEGVVTASSYGPDCSTCPTKNRRRIQLPE